MVRAHVGPLTLKASFMRLLCLNALRFFLFLKSSGFLNGLQKERLNTDLRNAKNNETLEITSQSLGLLHFGRFLTSNFPV